MLLGEALSLGVKAGVDLETLVEVIQGSSGMTRKMGFSYPDYLFRGNLGARAFALDLGAKDLRPSARPWLPRDRHPARLRQPGRAALHRGLANHAAGARSTPTRW